jgi:hypothetical protein
LQAKNNWIPLRHDKSYQFGFRQNSTVHPRPQEKSSPSVENSPGGYNLLNRLIFLPFSPFRPKATITDHPAPFIAGWTFGNLLPATPTPL